MATAPIQSLAWEPPYAMGMALKKKTKQKKYEKHERGQQGKRQTLGEKQIIKLY